MNLEMLVMYLQSGAWKEVWLLGIFLEKYLDQRNAF